MLRIEYLYWLVGAFLLATAWFNLRARRWPLVVLGLCLVAGVAGGFGWLLLKPKAPPATLASDKLGLGRLIYQLPPTLCNMFLDEVFPKGAYESLDTETLLTISKFSNGFYINLKIFTKSFNPLIKKIAFIY